MHSPRAANTLRRQQPFPGRRRDDAGAVTAVFALTLPAVMLVLAVVLSGLTLAAHRIVAANAAGQIAIHEARQDHARAAAVAGKLPALMTVSRSDAGPLRCVTVTARLGSGPLQMVTAETTSCAARHEQRE